MTLESAKPAMEILQADADGVIERLERGETYREICTHYKVGVGTLCRFLDSTEDLMGRSARALARSAESLLDRGLHTLIDAPRDAVEIARARAIAQEFARRAGIRNPRYRDKVSAEISGPNGGPIETHELTEAERTARLAAIFNAARARRDQSVGEDAPALESAPGTTD